MLVAQYIIAINFSYSDKLFLCISLYENINNLYKITIFIKSLSRLDHAGKTISYTIILINMVYYLQNVKYINMQSMSQKRMRLKSLGASIPCVVLTSLF